MFKGANYLFIKLPSYAMWSWVPSKSFDWVDTSDLVLRLERHSENFMLYNKRGLLNLLFWTCSSFHFDNFNIYLWIVFGTILFSANKRLVYEEAKKAVERDRSMVKVSELSRHGLMEITRKRVRCISLWFNNFLPAIKIVVKNLQLSGQTLSIEFG